MIHLTRLIAAAALALAAPTAAVADADLERVSAYLNGLKTAQGTFLQANNDGSVSSGTYYISKPGLMRFDYAPPVPAVVISDGWWVAVVDRASNADPQRYPLVSTPLNLILQDDVDLTDEDMVQAVNREAGLIRITALDPDRPEIGTIELVFRDNPLALAEWIVTNEAGERTNVLLSDMVRDVSIPRRRFSIEAAVIDR
ncbi:MAG: outer membrane lipoprotein carrier protein LolA [Pseudomonadota bacterium]